MKQPLFSLGLVVATPAAAKLLNDHKVNPADLHQFGDWGLCCDEDAAVNEESVRHHARVMSIYEVGDQRIWLLTETNRSSSTFILPFEY